MADAPARPPLSTADAADPFAGWDSIPLFMQSLPADMGGTAPSSSSKPINETAEAGSNTLAALQALAYEGSPSDIAAGFKEQGNALYAARKYKDALGFYSRAIDEVGQQLSVLERRTLFSNRSACHLELGNYGSCLRDTAQVLGAPTEWAASSNPDEMKPDNWDKTTLKALLRSARALLALDKLDEAKDVLRRLRMLEEEMGQKEFAADVGRRWREEVDDKMTKRAKRQAEKVEKDRRKKEGDQAVYAALLARGVVLPKPTSQRPLFYNCPVDVEPPRFDPDSLPPTSLPSLPLVPASASPTPLWQPPPLDTPLVIPVFLLLPLAQPPTRDLCLGFHTQATFGAALESMEHDPAHVQLYIATKRGRVLKVGSKLELGKVLKLAATIKGADGKEIVGGDGWELKEGWALEMVGVPKGERGEAWIQEWKKEVKEGVGAIL